VRIETLGSVAKVISGYAFKSVSFGDTGVSVIKIKNIRSGHIDLSVCDKVHIDHLSIPERFHIKSGNILISLTGSHMNQPNSVVGRVAWCGRDTPRSLLNQRAGKVIVHNKQTTNSRYLFYCLSQPETGRAIASMANGAASQANISPTQVESLEIPLPPLAEQKRIAGILSAYDDLIENNFRRIKILEEMAQSLYREWFVHFRFPGHQTTEFQDSPLGAIPVGWEVKKLGEVASVNEEALRSNNVPSEIHYIDIKSVSTGCIDEVTTMPFSDAPSRARRVVKHGDVIWSTVRPNRRSFSVIINPIENLIASTGLAVLTPKRIPSTYLYQATTTQDFTSYLVNHATGAAYPAVNATTFKNAPIIVPSQDILNSFDELASALTRQINTLLNKNQNLRKTRDLLLPRLLTPNH
jgi:type I restriction enzyme S subunit